MCLSGESRSSSSTYKQVRAAAHQVNISGRHMMVLSFQPHMLDTAGRDRTTVSPAEGAHLVSSVSREQLVPEQP